MSDARLNCVTKMAHMQIQSGRIPKVLKKWNKDPVRSDKLQTGKVRNQYIMIMNMDLPDLVAHDVILREINTRTVLE